MISEHFDHYGDHYGFCEVHGENQSIKSLMPQTQLQNIKNFTKSATGHYHKTSDFFKHETRLFTLEDWMAPWRMQNTPDYSGSHESAQKHN